MKEVALEFKSFCDYNYYLNLGKKGKLIRLIITPSLNQFHHLTGAQRSNYRDYNRNSYFQKCINGEISRQDLIESTGKNQRNNTVLKLEVLKSISNFFTEPEYIFKKVKKGFGSGSYNQNYHYYLTNSIGTLYFKFTKELLIDNHVVEQLVVQSISKHPNTEGDSPWKVLSYRRIKS